jgi:hypothetical protein
MIIWYKDNLSFIYITTCLSARKLKTKCSVPALTKLACLTYFSRLLTKVVRVARVQRVPPVLPVLMAPQVLKAPQVHPLQSIRRMHPSLLRRLHPSLLRRLPPRRRLPQPLR